jgi:hypothetical protein
MSPRKKTPPVESLAKLTPITKRTVKIMRDESYAWWHLLRHEWLPILSMIFGVSLLLFFWEPIPPNVTGIAVGRQGTSDGIYGEKLAAFFAENGVKLNITYTEGGKQPISAMEREKSIHSAIVLGGLYKKHELDHKALSLGSSQYEPLWLFYRGNIVTNEQPVVHFATTTGIAIGESGSGSNAIVQEVIKSNRPDVTASYKLLEWPYLKSVDALIAGEIQALAVVDGFESPIIQKLLADPNIHIANFPLAPAYVKRLPQLDLVSIPRGSFSSDPISPATDINMVSTTLSLVVEKNLHPALQLLFLMAMDHLGESRDQFFAKQDEFPSHKDSNVPLAPIAKKYFTNGAPVALSYVGFRLASLSDRIWFFILSALAIVYPLYRLIPNFRSTLGDIKISDAQDMLYDLQERFVRAETIEQFDVVMRDFIQFQQEVNALIPRISVSHYYQLARPTEYVKKVSQERREVISRSQNMTQAKSET